MIAEFQQDDEVPDEKIDCATGTIEMNTNETLAPTITKINTQECRSDAET